MNAAARDSTPRASRSSRSVFRRDDALPSARSVRRPCEAARARGGRGHERAAQPTATSSVSRIQVERHEQDCSSGHEARRVRSSARDRATRRARGSSARAPAAIAARLDPELLDERGTRRAIRRKRVCLATCIGTARASGARVAAREADAEATSSVELADDDPRDAHRRGLLRCVVRTQRGAARRVARPRRLVLPRRATSASAGPRHSASASHEERCAVLRTPALDELRAVGRESLEAMKVQLRRAPRTARSRARVSRSRSRPSALRSCDT